MVFKLLKEFSLEQAFVVVALIFYSGALVSFIPGATSPLADAHPMALLVVAVANGASIVTLLLLAQHWQSALVLATREKLLWVLVGLVVTSILWSDLPDETTFQVIPFLRVTLFAVYFTTQFSLREQVRLLCWTFGIAAALSLFFAVALPQYGIVGRGFISNMEDIVHYGRWRGIYVHKTILGTMMVMGMATFLFQIMAGRKNRWLMILGFCFCFSLLQMSTTKGALAVFLLTMFLVPFYRVLRWKDTVLVPFLILTFLIGSSLTVLIIAHAEAALKILDRDITLTGRTIYWPLMLDKIWERPWFGYGYKTFWLGGWKGEVADVWRFLAVGNEPPHAHNGYLNLWFSIGLVGLCVFALGFFMTYCRAIAYVRHVKTLEGLVPIVYLTMTFLFNMTESFLVDGDIFWIMYVSAALSVHQSIVTADADVENCEVIKELETGSITTSIRSN